MRFCLGLLVVLPVCFALYFLELTRNDLWSSHEARAAQNARRMLDDNSWGLPRLFDGQPELQKPPAFYWLIATCARLRESGVDRWDVRLPAALSGLATVLLIWGFLTARCRPIAALCAALVLACTIHFTSAARTGRIDMPLTFCTTATVLLFASSVRLTVRIPLGAILLACALLLKGPIGMALPACTIVAFGYYQRIPSHRTALTLGVSCAGAVAMAAPWFIWVHEATQGEFTRVFFWHHNFARATGESTALAVHPWWYYLPRFAIDFLPATPLLIGGVWMWLRNKSQRSDEVAALGLVWLVAMIGLLSLAKFKRADYLLPAYPGAALFTGCLLEGWYQRLSERSRKIAVGAGLLLIIGCIAGWTWYRHHAEPQMEAARAQQPFATEIRRLAPPPQTILLFRVEAHLLAYHLGRPVHTLVEWGELNQRLAEPGTHWFVTRAEFVDECRDIVRTRRIAVVLRSEAFSLVKPLRPLVLMRTLNDDESDPCPNTMPKD